MTPEQRALIAERDGRSCVWDEGAVPAYVAEFLWDAVHDRHALLAALAEAEQLVETWREAAARGLAAVDATARERDAAEQREAALYAALESRTVVNDEATEHLWRAHVTETPCDLCDALAASRVAREPRP